MDMINSRIFCCINIWTCNISKKKNWASALNVELRPGRIQNVDQNTDEVDRVRQHLQSFIVQQSWVNILFGNIYFWLLCCL